MHLKKKKARRVHARTWVGVWEKKSDIFIFSFKNSNANIKINIAYIFIKYIT